MNDPLRSLAIFVRAALGAVGRKWFGVRTALLAEDGRTWGDRDIVNWLRNIHTAQLPWRAFTI